MFNVVTPSLKRLRGVLIALIAAFATALLARPAAAAANLHDFDHNAVIAVIVIAVLLFAIVVEVWRASRGDNFPFAIKTEKPSASDHGRHN